MKLDVLVFAAHPDDAELGCGGTIASLVKQGKKIGIVDLTRGEMGTRGTAETRMLEAEKASEILGLVYRNNLEIPDSYIQNTRENQLKVIQEVRRYQPHICFLGAPYDRHPDHGYATQMLLDALFYSGLRKIETKDENHAIQEPWRPKHILHFMQDRSFEPDFIYDITGFLDTKIESVLAYSSQFNVTELGNEPATYISSSSFFKQIEARARFYGHQGGCKLGEPFKYHHAPVQITDMEMFFKTEPNR